MEFFVCKNIFYIFFIMVYNETVMEVIMKKHLLKIFIVITLIIITILTVVFLNGYKLYKTTIDNLSLSDKIAKIKSDPSYVTYDEVPEYYLDAIIAVEDHRYREHRVVDLISLRKSNSFKYTSKWINRRRKHNYTASCKKPIFYDRG